MNLGDLDGDGISDLAVSAIYDDESGVTNGGAVYIIYLNADMTVKNYNKIYENGAGFTGNLDASDHF